MDTITRNVCCVEQWIWASFSSMAHYVQDWGSAAKFQEKNDRRWQYCKTMWCWSHCQDLEIWHKYGSVNHTSKEGGKCLGCPRRFGGGLLRSVGRTYMCIDRVGAVHFNAEYLTVRDGGVGRQLKIKTRGAIRESEDEQWEVVDAPMCNTFVRNGPIGTLKNLFSANNWTVEIFDAYLLVQISFRVRQLRAKHNRLDAVERGEATSVPIVCLHAPHFFKLFPVQLFFYE